MFRWDGDEMMRKIIEDVGLCQMETAIRMFEILAHLVPVVLLGEWIMFVHVLVVPSCHIVAQIESSQLWCR